MPRHTRRPGDSPALLSRAAAIGAAVLLGLTAAGCAGDGGATVQASQDTGAAAEAAEPNPLRNAYFGDLHTHTNFSYDAFLNGTRATPDDAYRYAKGGALTHAAGFEIQLDAPLDFYAVTDHASFLGMLPAVMDPEKDVSAPGGRARVRLRQRGRDGRRPAPGRGATSGPTPSARASRPTTRTWCARHGERPSRRPSATTIRAASRPSSATSSRAAPENQNLHRNVIFRGSAVPELPFSRLDSFNPEELWAWMDRNREAGIEALAIPHNSNGSNGLMFRLATYAGDPPRRRLRGDPQPQRAAGRDHPDQGHLRHPPRPLAQRRVGRLRDLVVPHRRRHHPEPARRQLRTPGLPERPAPRGRERLQPVPLRPRRGHRQPRRRRPGQRVQFLHRWRRPPRWARRYRSTSPREDGRLYSASPLGALRGARRG